tara:strand:- start:20706 stop:20864 length:159 start_codon:yes stop_codon:yes gene_type:complete
MSMEDWFKYKINNLENLIDKDDKVRKESKFLNLYLLLLTIWEDYKKDKKWQK